MSDESTGMTWVQYKHAVAMALGLEQARHFDQLRDWWITPNPHLDNEAPSLLATAGADQEVLLRVLEVAYEDGRERRAGQERLEQTDVDSGPDSGPPSN